MRKNTRKIISINKEDLRRNMMRKKNTHNTTRGYANYFKRNCMYE